MWQSPVQSICLKHAILPNSQRGAKLASCPVLWVEAGCGAGRSRRGLCLLSSSLIGSEQLSNYSGWVLVACKVLGYQRVTLLAPPLSLSS